MTDSALHAPQAGSGDVEFYPDIYDTAAVLVCRLTWNHPLPDGNKQAAWATPASSSTSTTAPGTPTHPSSDQAEEAMLAIAAGEVDETWTASWLRERVRFADQG
ncbi:MAG: hypothetical protein GXP34_08490 [Actinobacteria bacterium]|nr:hypothetical protein [Actinomycetota bacterium]